MLAVGTQTQSTISGDFHAFPRTRTELAFIPASILISDSQRTLAIQPGIEPVTPVLETGPVAELD